MSLQFFEEKKSIAQRIKKHQTGIYITVVVHLLVIVLLLASKLSSARQEQMSILLDFSREDAKEMEEKLLQEKQQLAEEVDRLLRDAREGKVIRNVAVNTEDAQTSTLKDDKGINEQVYEDARLLQEKIDANRKLMQDLQHAKNEVPVRSETKKNEPSSESFKGASVISYTLEGRRAMYLPVPVYKCLQGGDVCVQIEVNQGGYVIKANVVASVSASDECLHDAAVKAAKQSRFNANESAAKVQTGTIIYRFVAQ